MSFLKKIVAGVKDVAKAVSYVVAAPVNSITGHVYTPEYETTFGQAVGSVLENSVDNVHEMGKSFADTLFRGLPSKLRNKIFPKSVPQSLGHYETSGKDYGNKWLNKLSQFSSGLGSMFASSVGPGGGGGGGGSQGNGGADDKPSSSDVTGVAGLVGVGVLVLVIIYVLSRIFK